MERITSLLKSAVSYSRLRGLWTLHKRSISAGHCLQYKWEPELNLEPEIPEYETLDIKIQGYDYNVLESFTKYVQRMAVHLDIDCSRFPAPAKKLDVKTYEFGKKDLIDSFNLNYYERIVQLEDTQSTQLPLLLEIVWGNTPEGVQITVKKNTEEDQEHLYIPDHEKQKLEGMLDEVDRRTVH